MNSPNSNPFDPSDRMLRQFAVLWIIFFGAAAVLQEVRQERHLVAVVLATLAVIVGPLGIISPRTIRPLFVGWMKLVHPIGWVISRLILGIAFYGLFTPISFLFRVIRRDELRLKAQPDARTYWQPKERARDQKTYLRQF